MKGKLSDIEKKKRKNAIEKGKREKRNHVTMCSPIKEESLSTSETAAPKNIFPETHQLWSLWKQRSILQSGRPKSNAWVGCSCTSPVEPIRVQNKQGNTAMSKPASKPVKPK